MKTPTDLTGEVFGRLKVLGFFEKAKSGTRWHCICECGKEKVIYRTNLVRGISKSCGCIQKESKTIHGFSRRRLYEIWSGMKKRCFNKNCKAFENYGGRGIKVCDEWLEYKPFHEWAYSNGYKEGLTIDRINNNGNYEPLNCRWVTRTTQNNNTRKNVFLEIDGDIKTVSEWARLYNLQPATVARRAKMVAKEKI